MDVLPDLIQLRDPPAKRAPYVEGDKEKHFTEPAVMLAYAMHLLNEDNGLTEVEIHPDGVHGNQFDIRHWLERQGFVHSGSQGITDYAGKYSRGVQSVLVTIVPGLGDVRAINQNYTIVAECKGGIINTKHPGSKSNLRSGLCEAVGLLMARDISNEHQYAVVPLTNETQRLAERMRPRCTVAGIGIILIKEDGSLVS